MMTDAEEGSLLSEKFDEVRAWPEGWSNDGLHDFDEFPIPSMTFYRQEFGDFDKFPVLVEVEFVVPSQPTYLVHFDAREHFECPDRLSAIAKYDAALGSLIGDLRTPVSR